MGSLVSGAKSKHAGRLSAWSISVAVSAGLRWGELFNAPPSTLLLINERLVWFDAKPKRDESLEEYHGGGSFLHSKENKRTITKGYALPKKESGDYDMDFRICQPLEPEDEDFAAAPAFWSCAYKMEAYILDLVGIPKVTVLCHIA